MSIRMRGLYPILDLDSLARRGLGPVEIAEALLAARPPMLQLRAKRAAPRDTLALLRALREPCRRAGALLFANDRPDLAVLADCDGIHVGQDDLDVAEVRRFAPALAVGVSTHDLAQLEAALAARPSYVAFGPVFATSSKDRPDPTVGLALLESAASKARAAGCPLVAIGGIDLERAKQVARHAQLGAVIGALMPGPDATVAAIAERAAELHRELGGVG